MSVQDKFDGARNVYAGYMAFLRGVAQQIGMDQAVAQYVAVSTAANVETGKALRAQAGTKQIDAKTAYMMTSTAIEGAIGMTFEVTDESPRKVVFNVGRCAIYEACEMAGMDHESIETLCRTALVSVDAMTKELNPKLSYRLLEYRSAATGCCKEEIVLAE